MLAMSVFEYSINITYRIVSYCTAVFTINYDVVIYQWLKLQQICIHSGIPDQCQEWTFHVQVASAATVSGWRQTL